MAVLSITTNQTLRAAASLAANTTQTADLDLETSGPLQATVYVASTPSGSVTAGSQLTVNVLVAVDGSGTTWSTVPITSVAIPSVASTIASVAIVLEGGKRYRFSFFNTDVSNALTTVTAIYSKVTAIG